MKRFVVIEGIDGSGKSSVSKALAQKLTDAGMKVALTAEPSDGEIGRLIRKGVGGTPFTEALLFTADRSEHTEQMMRWVSEDYVVLCDRYYASTLAYQSVSNVPMEWLMAINEPIIREPDITFLLDLDPEEGLRRAGNRGELSRFEIHDYLQKVRENYLKLAETRKFKIMDASRPVDETADAMFRMIMEE